MMLKVTSKVLVELMFHGILTLEEAAALIEAESESPGAEIPAWLSEKVYMGAALLMWEPSGQSS